MPLLLWSEYATFTTSTATYTRLERFSPIPALGLVEAVESADKTFQRCERDTVRNDTAVLSKLGDVVWYCVRTALDHGVDVAFIGRETIAGGASPGRFVPELLFASLAAEASHVAGALKRAMQGDGGTAELERALKRVMGAVERCAGVCYTGVGERGRIEDAVELNVRKLQGKAGVSGATLRRSAA